MGIVKRGRCNSGVRRLLTAGYLPLAPSASLWAEFQSSKAALVKTCKPQPHAGKENVAASGSLEAQGLAARPSRTKGGATGPATLAVAPVHATSTSVGSVQQAPPLPSPGQQAQGVGPEDSQHIAGTAAAADTGAAPRPMGPPAGTPRRAKGAAHRKRIQITKSVLPETRSLAR